jgi:histidine ammonia-lyase
MYENTAGILAIEWLAACQGLDFRAPLKTSAALEEARTLLRAEVPFYERDRYFAPDIERARRLIDRRSLLPYLLPACRISEFA